MVVNFSPYSNIDFMMQSNYYIAHPIYLKPDYTGINQIIESSVQSPF